MKRITLLILVLTLFSFAARAQWRAGVTVGTTSNHYVFDRQYMSDYNSKDRWGLTMGVSGQYNFTDWLGVRADLNWTQKNYGQDSFHNGQLFGWCRGLYENGGCRQAALDADLSLAFFMRAAYDEHGATLPCGDTW